MMFSSFAAHVQGASRRISLAMVMILSVGAALTLVALSAQPAFALTNGQAIATSYPRVAMWWPNVNTSLTEVSKLDYVVPYEWQPTSPDATRLANLQSLNPAQLQFADASTSELNYRQPNSAGAPSGSATYDSERIGAIPTSWILKQVGSTLSAAITTVSTPQQTISVVDSTKFRAGNLVIIDDEKCLVVSVSTGKLVVRRGWAGSTAVNHAAGARIAAAVSAWPYSVKVDLTDECPLGRATGEIATPGTGTERARDWMVRRTAAHYGAAGFDGVAIDLGIAYISWFKGTGTYQYLSIASRSNPDAEVDYTAYDAKWAAALNTFHASLRTAVGPDAAILVNEATPAYGSLNGARIEGFPTKTTSTSVWSQRIIGPNKTYYPSYLEWCASARQPNFTTLQTYGESPTDYQLMRFGLGSALMGDGFYAFKVSHSEELNRYDEYDNAGAGKGYLGKPVGAMRSALPALTTPDLLGGYGAFSDTTTLNGWTLYNRSGYSAAKSLDAGTAKIVVAQSAGSISGVEFYRPNVAVTSGAAYTLSFRARADRPLNVQAQVQQVASPWATYMATPQVAVTTSWKTYEIPMTASGSDAAALLKFTLGSSVGTVWLDDVKLQVGDRSVYRRDYEGGVALVNPSDKAVTISLGGSFRKIKGTQAPQVNDGSLVTAVTLQPKDGLVLLSTTTQPPVVPTTDSTAPTTTDDHVATYNGTATIRLTSTDALSGVASTTWTLDGASGSGTTVTTSVVGDHTLSYFSTDVAGNVESQHTVTFSVAASTTSKKKPPVYRFYNTKTGTHFYTASTSERDSVLASYSSTYLLDGMAYSLNTEDPANNAPLYRFFNKKNGSHFYTANEAEKNALLANASATYTFDGPAYDVCLTPVPGATTVYRFFNKGNGSHFYTASESEKNQVLGNLSATYTLDGPAFYLAP